MTSYHSSFYEPWVYSIIAASLVGFAGIVPLIFIPTDLALHKQKYGVNPLQLLLSFGVGGLLSDVFLHLLPEAWASAIEAGASATDAFSAVGACALAGIFIFLLVETLAVSGQTEEPKEGLVNGGVQTHDTSNGVLCGAQKGEGQGTEGANNKVVGYLNLVANGVDNFAHGLAVAGSFLVSPKTGVMTTAAILLHEVPHEIGDFAILLKSGFNRWEAARAQLYTAGIGLLGALCTLCIGTSDFVCGAQVYILGFTSGGFLNIALVTILPELMRERRPKHAAAQLAALLAGMAVMAGVALLC